MDGFEQSMRYMDKQFSCVGELTRSRAEKTMIAKKKKKTYTRITTENNKKQWKEKTLTEAHKPSPHRKTKNEKTKASCVITLTMILFILKSSKLLGFRT